jgi:hypothetical protein
MSAESRVKSKGKGFNTEHTELTESTEQRLNHRDTEDTEKNGRSLPRRLVGGLREDVSDGKLEAGQELAAVEGVVDAQFLSRLSGTHHAHL